MVSFLELFLGPAGPLAAALLIFLAGLSDGVGTRTVVLLINRITPMAFLLSLLASALLFLASAAIWVAGTWLAARYLFDMADTLPAYFIALSVAYAPFLLSALALLPLVGPLIRLGLRLWSFGIGLWVLRLLELELWQAILCAALGAGLVAGASWLLSEPASSVGRMLWAAVTGTPRPLRRDELPRVIPGYERAAEVRE